MRHFSQLQFFYHNGFSFLHGRDSYDVVLAWDPNSESDLAGYKIYGSEGSPGPPYDLIDTYSLDDIDPANPAGRISDLDDSSEYYIVVTA